MMIIIKKYRNIRNYYYSKWKKIVGKNSLNLKIDALNDIERALIVSGCIRQTYKQYTNNEKIPMLRNVYAILCLVANIIAIIRSFA